MIEKQIKINRVTKTAIKTAPAGKRKAAEATKPKTIGDSTSKKPKSHLPSGEISSESSSTELSDQESTDTSTANQTTKHGTNPMGRKKTADAHSEDNIQHPNKSNVELMDTSQLDNYSSLNAKSANNCTPSSNEMVQAMMLLTSAVGSIKRFIDTYVDSAAQIQDPVIKTAEMREMANTPMLTDGMTAINNVSSGLCQLATLLTTKDSTYAAAARLPPQPREVASSDGIIPDESNIVPANTVQPASAMQEITLKSKTGVNCDPIVMFKSVCTKKGVQTHNFRILGDVCTITVINEEHQTRALELLQNGTYNDQRITDLFTVTHDIRSFHSVRTEEFTEASLQRIKWHSSGNINLQEARALISEDNPHWFASPDDIEKIDMRKIERQNQVTKYSLDIYISSRSRDKLLTAKLQPVNIDIGPVCVPVYHNIRVDACFKCLEFGHKGTAGTRECSSDIRCRYCYGKHAHTTCSHKDTPRCYRCDKFNKDGGHPIKRTDHHAISSLCQYVRNRKEVLRLRLQADALTRTENKNV